MAVVAGVGLRQRRQQDGAKRHPEHAGRQFHQTVGVVHPGHRTGDQEGGEDGVDDQRDLADRDTEDGRPHLLKHAPDAAVAQVQARQHEHADLLQVRQLVEQLRQPADQHRPAQRHHRWIEVRGEEQREDDHADVQQGRHERRHREAVPGVEDRPRQRGQRDQQDVGEGHPQQVGGQLELFRRSDEARRGHPDHPRRGEHAQRRDQRQNQGQQTGNIGDEHARRLLALLGLVFGKNRHEGLGERAFGEDPAQQVGQLESHEEGVGGHAGAEHARHDGVPDEAEHSRHHGHGADRSQRFE
ncbi:hypothetical protein D3C78_722670 [compost metagenome]